MLAQDIRDFVRTKYVVPARNKGQTTILVKAGDVHKGLGLINKHPAVCDAINTDKFQSQSNVTIVKVTGPEQGSTTTFEIKI